MHSKTLSVDRRTGLILLVGVCSVGFFIADVATPTYFKEPFPAMLAMGVVTAQLTVICVWGTLVRGTFWIRLPWTLLLLVISWCGFAWGITIEKGSPNTASMLGAAMLWMFGFVTSFVPLKIAAMCFRWQIVHHSENNQTAARNFNYAIRDIMIGTLLLAMTMGIGRVMLPSDEISFTRALHASSLNEPELLFAITLYGIISLLVKLPCIWISLGEKAEKIRSRIGFWCIYCLFLAVVEIGLLVAVLGSPGSDFEEIFGGIIISHQLMGAIMLGVCCTLRGLGYRLERSVSRQAEPESAATIAAPRPESA
ncbi:membrane protein [Rhodopirellula maiorica SM1]|uniref:Membrane protein n=2 Tax=Novipirellula TaxID=2795426 RepID=M5S1X0_9BACT|nr:membrane protein [Rhodopirellula maiorica SM1]